MKVVQYSLACLVTLLIGIYLSWVCWDMFINIYGKPSSSNSIRSTVGYFQYDDFKVFLLSLIGGVGGIITASWHAVNAVKAIKELRA